MPSFFQDLRHGARSLRRRPSFTLATVLALALGICANRGERAAAGVLAAGSVRAVLVSTQVALAMVLLVGAGLLVRFVCSIKAWSTCAMLMSRGRQTQGPQ